METFKINEYLIAVCEYKKTRNGFKHTATLLINGIERGEVKCCYLNRTWERYTYESVLRELLSKSKSFLSADEVKEFETAIGNGSACDMQHLKTIAMVAGMGEVFGKTQKEENDWKARMLKAGLEGRGLIMPDDWDTLDEETKETRLNGAIEQIK